MYCAFTTIGYLLSDVTPGKLEPFMGSHDVTMVWSYATRNPGRVVCNVEQRMIDGLVTHYIVDVQWKHRTLFSQAFHTQAEAQVALHALARDGFVALTTAPEAPNGQACLSYLLPRLPALAAALEHSVFTQQVAA